MDYEEKQLLLKDLCARLPYNIRCYYNSLEIDDDIQDGISIVKGINGGGTLVELESGDTIDIEDIKPYLRPMSSMTKEEKEEMKEIIEIELTALEGPEGFSVATAASSAFEIDFYNKHHLDYRGLIPMGLALEAPEDMYKIE